MDTPKITPKDFFLWAGAMIALYSSIVAFLSLLFSYIDHLFPDALDYAYDPYSGAMRTAIAALIVLFPLALYLLRVIRHTIEEDSTRAEVWVRRWALVLTIFLAGATAAVDLITLIYYFLDGNLSARFALKVVVVFLVAAGFFMHFLADLRGYWYRNPERARMIGWGSGLLVLVSVVAGFFIMGTPGQVRLYRLDDQRISDLQTIQYQVTNYWQSKGKLPVSIKDMEDPLSGFIAPKDPETAQEYGYRVTKAPYSFEVCATFRTDSKTGSTKPASAALHVGGIEAEHWQHVAEQTCFERTIDPAQYPVFKK